MAVVDFVPSWTDRLLSRLYFQFRDDPTWQAWCALLGKQFDDLEVAGQSLLAILNIADASGTVLDLIGRIVGQTRGGVSDATYRLYLKARIRANRSGGLPEDLLAILVLLGMGKASSIPINVTNLPPASVLVTAGPITIDPYLVAINFLARATAAGVNLMFGWFSTAKASTLMLGYSVANGTTVPTTAQSPGWSGNGGSPIAGGSLGGLVGTATAD